MNMIFTEWNWDDALEVRGEERYARGRQEERVASIQKLMKTMNLSAEQAMDALEIPQKERVQYQKLMQTERKSK